MNSTLKAAALLYAANIVFMLGTGLVFEFRTEFMPFHSDVIETAWADVDPASQTLYLGMMRTEAAGFLASGVALAVLLWIPFRKRQAWSFWAMTGVGIVEYAPTFFANYHVSTVTNASPPWQLMLSLIVSLLLALGLALRGARQPA